MLEEEDHDGDDEPHEVALAQERLLRAQSFPRLTLLRDRGLDLRHLGAHAVVFRAQAAEVRKVRDRLVDPVLGRKPARRFLDCEQAERQQAGGNELEAEWDPPDGVSRLDVDANPN